jgi:hypothetical protein
MAGQRHNLTTGFMVGAFLAPLAFVASLPQVFDLSEAERLQTQREAPYRKTRDATSQAIQRSQQGSRIPLDLVMANRCTPVELKDSDGEQAVFLANVEVVARTVNGQAVPPGEYVCSRKGQSAQVGLNGFLTNIQSVQLEQLSEYQVAFDELKQLRGF